MLADITHIDDDEPRAAPIDNYAKACVKVKIRIRPTKAQKTKVRRIMSASRRSRLTPFRKRQDTIDLHNWSPSRRSLMPNIQMPEKLRSLQVKKENWWEKVVPASAEKASHKRLYRRISTFEDQDSLVGLLSLKPSKIKRGSSVIKTQNSDAGSQ